MAGLCGTLCRPASNDDAARRHDRRPTGGPRGLKIFRIWIQSSRTGEKPAWGAKPFPKGERSGQFVVLASGFANDNESLPIRTDARIVAATLKAGETADYVLGAGRRGYLVPATGAVEI